MKNFILPNKELICIISNVERISLNQDKHFDAIFMDVELESMSGIEAGMSIRETDLNVLFIMISAYEKYKMDVCSLHVFDFLNKPFKKAGVINVLERVERYCENKIKHTFISFKIKGVSMSFNTADILYLECINRRIKIITHNEVYEFYGNIGEEFKRLKLLSFGNPHISFIVNLKHIKEMKRNEIILNTQSIIPISKHKLKAFKDEYATFCQSQIREKVA